MRFELELQQSDPDPHHETTLSDRKSICRVNVIPLLSSHLRLVFIFFLAGVDFATVEIKISACLHSTLALSGTQSRCS